MRTLRSWLLVLLSVFVAVQLLSLAALVLLEKITHITYVPSVTSITEGQRTMLEDFLAGRAGHVAYSSVLGWTANPNGRAPLYRAHPTGTKGERGYTRVPGRGVLRIATFGDFVFGGSFVKQEDSWQEGMMRAHRNVEVLNFGVQDSGIDQAFLRYRYDGAAYKPDIVIIGFFPDNVYTSVNVYRPFFNPNTDLPLAKPRYVLRNGRLVLLPTPLRTLSEYANLLTDPARVMPALGRHDYFYQSTYHRGNLAVLPSVRLFQILRNRLMRRRKAAQIEQNGVFNVDSEAFKVTAATFDEFVDAAKRAGSVPIIVAMPRAWDIDEYRRSGRKVYAPLLERFKAKRYRYVDLMEGFEKYGKGMTAAELAPEQYSRAGNQVVANVLWQFLVAQRLIDPKNFRRR